MPARLTRSIRLITAVVVGVGLAATSGLVSSANAETNPLDASPPFTGISVSATPGYGGADATYTIGFTTPTDTSIGGFNMDMPAGTQLPADASDYAISDGATSYAVHSASVGESGETATITMGSALPAATTVTMTIQHVTNPPGCDCLLYLNADNGSGDVASPHYTILGGYAAAVMKDSPSVYYRLGEASGATTAADLSGNDDDATYAAAATEGITGALPTDSDTAASTDGSGPIATASDAALPLGNSARTVEGWVKIGTDSTSDVVLVNYGSSGSGCGAVMQIGVLGDGTVINQNYNCGGVGWNTPFNLRDGHWHLIDFVMDGSGNDTAYLDGVSLGTKADGSTNTSGTSDQGLLIGDGFDRGGAASVDEVAIYPTALGKAQIDAHLAAAVEGPNPPTGLTAAPSTNSVTLSWTASTGDATHVAPLSYHVQVVDDHGSVVADTSRSRSSVCADATCSLTLGSIPAGSYVASVAGRDDQWQGPAASVATGTITGATDSSTYARAVLADHPSVYYRLDETSDTAVAADSSGNGVNGRFQSSATLDHAGALPDDADTSASTDGSGPIATASDQSLPAGSAARTVEGWVRLPKDGTGNAVLVDYGGSGSCGSVMELGVVASGSVINQNWDCDGLNWATPFSLEDGQWHLIDFVMDGSGTDTLYLDGVSLGTKSDSGTNTQLAGVTGLSIGNGFDTSGAADVDEVAIYDHALSASRVSAHLAASVQGPNPPTGLTAEGGANRATVSWTASAIDETHPAPVSYRVQLTSDSGTGPADTTRPASTVCTGTSCQVSISGLASGDYTVTVAGRADDRQGPGASTTVTISGASATDDYSQSVLADNPLAYYRLDEPAGTTVAQDSSGNGADARYRSSATLGVAGALPDGDTSASTDGSGPIATASDQSLPAGSAARTVEGWVRLPKDGTGNAVLVDYGGSGSCGSVMELGVVASGSVINQNWDCDGLNWATPFSLEDGQWHLIDFVMDGSGTDTLYLDGVSLGTKSDSGTNTQLAGVTGLSIGNGFDTAGAADVDEVAIYDHALSADRVTTHYDLGSRTAASQSQTITFDAPAGVAYGNDPAPVAASASSGLPVAVTSSTTGVCSIDGGGLLDVLAAGSCTLTASQGGDEDYDAAPDVTVTFDVAPAPLTVTASDEEMTQGGSVPTPTASYDGFVDGDTASSLTTAPTCVTDVDTETTSCSGAVDANYDFTYVSGTLSINGSAKQGQTITFAAPDALTYGGHEDLTATASSGLGVSFASTTTRVCTVSGTTLTSVAAGTCKVTASQAGDDDYNAAPGVTRSVTVAKAPLRITASDATMTQGGTVPTPTASFDGFVDGDTASSLTTAPTCVADVSTKKTSCSGAVDPNYYFTYVSGTLTINGSAKQSQTITFPSPSTVQYGGIETLKATATSGLAVKYSSNKTSVCTISGDTLKAVGVGSCTITASQAGNGTYDAATPVTQSVRTDQTQLTIAASNESMTAGGTPPTPTPAYSGFASGENEDSLTTKPTCVSNVAARTTTCSGAVDPNYKIVYVAGTLTINAKQKQAVTVHVTPADLTYARTKAVLHATATSGLVVTGLSASPARVCSVPGGHVLQINGAGRCTITATQPGNAEFAPASGTAVVQIAKAPLEVDATSILTVSGAKQPAVGAIYDGFVRGDDVSALQRRATCKVVRIKVRVKVHGHKKWRRKPVTRCSHARSLDYSFQYVDGGVHKAANGYTFVNPSIVYLPEGRALSLHTFPITVVKAAHKRRAKVIVDPSAGTRYGLPPGVTYRRKHGSIIGLAGHPSTPGSYEISLRAVSGKHKTYDTSEVIRIDVY